MKIDKRKWEQRPVRIFIDTEFFQEGDNKIGYVYQSFQMFNDGENCPFFETYGYGMTKYDAISSLLKNVRKKRCDPKWIYEKCDE